MKKKKKTHATCKGLNTFRSVMSVFDKSYAKKLSKYTLYKLFEDKIMKHFFWDASNESMRKLFGNQFLIQQRY